MDKEGTIKCNQVLNDIEKDKTISDKRKFINNQSKLLHHLHKSVYNMKHLQRITGQRKNIMNHLRINYYHHVLEN